jgi:two-component system nitrogen regulation sensor histidine kinase NtrY
MNSPDVSPRTQGRRRRERIAVVAVLVLVVFFGFLEGWFFRFKSDLPLWGNILLFALINVNVILLLLLVYLVLRNIVKLVFERKRDILGHQLRTRLVIAFVGLTLIPTIPLFLLATRFISFSLDYWFSHEVEESLELAVTLGKDYLEQEKEELAVDSRLLREEWARSYGTLGPPAAQTELALTSFLEQHLLDAIYLFDSQGTMTWQPQRLHLPQADVEWLESFSLQENHTSSDILSVSLQDQREVLVARVVFPSPEMSPSEKRTRLVLLRLLPPRLTQKMFAITSGYENYLQLDLLRTPLKTSHLITFSIVTLLVIFAAIWFGFLLAKNITVPVQNLVAATQRVAEGDLHVRLDWEREDEIGMLIASFNKMVGDLQESQEQLATAYEALQQSHQELEERRRYMEIVLKNVAAGVVSVNAEGKIVTINKSAESMFGLRAEEILGRIYSELLEPGHMEIVESFMGTYQQKEQSHLERQVQAMVGNRPMVLLIKASILKDEQDHHLGAVVVFDDLTDLEKAQRMAAWREVARRIAHEIKNPLTPVQLSAQRLRRKYADLLSDPQGSLLEECTRTIVQQVEDMKRLVNEFSNFARLPRAHPTPCDLGSVAEESLALYRHTHPHISFILEKEEAFPLLNLDPNQFKQVMINLLENAIHACDGGEGTIRITLAYDPILRIARLECADTGHGLPPEDKLRIFEPYYSTKEKGTGLGLAIVASIVADHNGFIRVRENVDRGTVMTIELPG